MIYQLHYLYLVNNDRTFRNCTHVALINWKSTGLVYFAASLLFCGDVSQNPGLCFQLLLHSCLFYMSCSSTIYNSFTHSFCEHSILVEHCSGFCFDAQSSKILCCCVSVVLSLLTSVIVICFSNCNCTVDIFVFIVSCEAPLYRHCLLSFDKSDKYQYMTGY